MKKFIGWFVLIHIIPLMLIIISVIFNENILVLFPFFKANVYLNILITGYIIDAIIALFIAMVLLGVALCTD